MSVMYPSWGQPQTIDQIRAASSFKQLHPTMQDRVLRLITASNGAVGLGVGFRSEGEQRQLFLSRYVVDPSGSVEWDGKRWRKKNEGDATAAPPGRSMHELGLAADLAGDHGWVVANSSRFDLKTFASVNDEPWHVQPVELPNSRADYEQLGSPWNGNGGPTPAPQRQGGSTRVEVVPDMRGPAVGRLQQILIRLGLIKDTTANRDQFYGPATQEVIKKFQAAHGLEVDGRVGPKTWAALLGT
jgi:Putative peptidoglycan binding domain/D-alanyl-D-alanine carboxypeptidase